MEAFLEAAERERLTIRAIMVSAQKQYLPAMQGSKKEPVLRRAGISVAISALIDAADKLHDKDLFYQDGYSVQTEDMPSSGNVTFEEPINTQEEKSIHARQSETEYSHDNESVMAETEFLLFKNRHHQLNPCRKDIVGKTNLRPGWAVDRHTNEYPSFDPRNRGLHNTRSQKEPPNKKSRTICYRCYALGNVSPSCSAESYF